MKFWTCLAPEDCTYFQTLAPMSPYCLVAAMPTALKGLPRHLTQPPSSRILEAHQGATQLDSTRSCYKHTRRGRCVSQPLLLATESCVCTELPGQHQVAGESCQVFHLMELWLFRWTDLLYLFSSVQTVTLKCPDIPMETKTCGTIHLLFGYPEERTGTPPQVLRVHSGST